jgi:hypothetical protein
MTEPANVHPIPQRVGQGGAFQGMRVRDNEYGTGTVVMVTSIGIQVHWDQELTGTREHVLMHDVRYVEAMERL